MSAAWNATFWRALDCNVDLGIESALGLIHVSGSPSFFMAIRHSIEKGGCVLRGSIGTAPIVGSVGLSLDQLGYYLDLPADRDDFFSLRFNVQKATLKYLALGESPTWKGFFIDDPQETIEMSVSCNAAICKTPEEAADFKKAEMERIKDFIPQKIALRTDLLLGGPQVVREFAYQGVNPKVNGPTTLPFYWKRTAYKEQRSVYGGAPWPP
jgi:hypothetical protein